MQQFKSDNDLIFEAYQSQQLLNEAWWMPVIMVGSFLWKNKAVVMKLASKAKDILCKPSVGNAVIKGSTAAGIYDVASSTGDAIKSVGDAVASTGDGAESFLSSVGDMLNNYGFQIGAILVGIAAAGIASKYLYDMFFKKEPPMEENTSKLLKIVNQAPLSNKEKYTLISKILETYPIIEKDVKQLQVA